MAEYASDDVEKLHRVPLVHDTTHPDETDDDDGAAGALVALDGPPVDGGVPTYDVGTGKHTSVVPSGSGLSDGNKGDITVSGSGTVWTINAGAITNAKLRDSSALSVIGRSANSTGTPADIAAANEGEVLRRSGTSLGFGTVATAGLASDAVTYAKMQNVSAASRLLGRGSASGAGDPEEITIGAGLTMSGTTLNSDDNVHPEGVCFDGSGFVPSAGKILRYRLTKSGTITKATIIGDRSGSAEIDIKVCDFASFPGGLASIVASTPPTLSSSETNEDTTLASWDTALTEGDMIEFSLTSADTLRAVTLILTVE